MHSLSIQLLFFFKVEYLVTTIQLSTTTKGGNYVFHLQVTYVPRPVQCMVAEWALRHSASLCSLDYPSIVVDVV
jgi:hypothetical protein